jgi:hypothetical protein
MAKSLGNRDQTSMAMAALFAALVEALRKDDTELPLRFNRQLEKIWRLWEGLENAPDEAMQTLRWTSYLIREIGKK